MKFGILIFAFMMSLSVSAEELAVTAPTLNPTPAPVVDVVKAAPIQVSESEIPVHLDNAKKSAASDSPWMRMFMGLSVAAILSVGAWVLVRRAKTKSGSKEAAPQIKVLTQHYLGPKRSLAIIRVAGESILIGVTDQNISLIKELSLLDEDVPVTVPTNFNQSLEDAEDFSMTGIKDFVSTRLKNMRTIQ